MKNSSLTQLPNIGKVLEKRLKEVEIETAEQLRSNTAENTFIKLKTIDEGACLHELMALEGAIQGIKSELLDPARKEELKIFHRQLSKKTTDKNIF